MIQLMTRRLDMHFGAVLLGVCVDQIASFAIGMTLALCLPTLGIASAAVGQALYEAACIGCGVGGGWAAAQFARRSMVAHGVAVGLTSLAVSTALGMAAHQRMFDARGLSFALMAFVAAVLGGWLASLLPVRRREPARA